MSEACFQRNVLRFSGDKQYIRYGVQYQYDAGLGQAGAAGRKTPLPDFEIPLVRVSEGTHPAGSGS